MFTPFAFIQTITTVTPISPSSVQYLLMGGSFTSFQNPYYGNIIKLNPNNTVDTTFNMGSVGFSSAIYAIVPTSESKLFAAGNATSYSGSTSFVTRLNLNGTRDASFNAGNTGISARTLLPFNDGTVFIGGNGTSYSQSAITTYHGAYANSNGTLNLTYFSASRPLGFDTQVNTVATQSDGKILVGGNFIGFGPNYSPYIFRIKPNGDPDPLVNIGTSGFSFVPTVVAIQSDGKYIIGGSFTTYNGVSAPRIIRINPNGTRDNSFNTGTGLSATPTFIKIQSDGKIIICGAFTTYSGSTSNGVVRINPSGTLDTTFNIGTGFTGGAVWSVVTQSAGNLVFTGEFTSYSGSARNGIVGTTNSGSINSSFNVGNGISSSVAGLTADIQSDGKIIVAGNFTTYSGSTPPSSRIVRINTNGTLDSTFGASVTTGFNNTVISLTIQTDGKVLVLGNFTTYNSTSSLRIARLNSDGTYDSSYNVGAGLNSTINYSPSILQSGSRIYAVGNFTTYSGSTVNRIICTNLSGALDPTFNSGVNSTSSAAGFSGGPNNIALDPSGNLIAVGNNSAYKNSPYLIRFNSDWTQDTSFKSGIGFSSNVNSIAVQPDDKIVVGGAFTSYSGSTMNYLARLNSDGTLDPTFRKATTTPNSTVSHVYLSNSQPGKIYVAGNFTTYSGSNVNYLMRLNSSGSIDRSFSSSASTAFNAQNAVIAEDSSGSLYVGNTNTATYGSNQVYNYFKLTPSGALDPSWVTSSVSYNNSTLSLGAPFNSGIYSIYIDSSGSQYVGGGFTTYKTPMTPNAIMINSQNATLSSSFNIGFQGFSSTPTAFATQSNGKIIAVGAFTQYSGSGTNTSRMVRLNPNGTIDPTFVIGTGFNSTVFNVVIQPDDKIIAFGAFGTFSGSTAPGLIRLNPNGNRDTTFNPGTGTNLSPNYALALQSDGKVLIGGSFTAYSGSTSNLIARINSNGTLDTTFNVGAGFSAATVPYQIKIQPDGKVVVAGTFTTYSGSTSNRIVRINPSGTLDTTFNIGSTGFNNAVQGFDIQSDGKIVVIGQFTSYSGSSINRIIRINPSGTRDTTFNVGTGLSQLTQLGANSVTIDLSGSIYVANNFSTYSGSTVNSLVKINPSGAIDPTFPTGSQTFNGTGINVNTAASQYLYTLLLLNQ
jgi:uncharacterized delta-60 repeat protein